MSLPHVQVTLNATGTGEVLVDGEKLPGVIGVQITGHAGGVPQVAVTLRPDQVVTDLPESGVTVVQAGGGATPFADGLNPARLEALALETMAQMSDCTTGEAFAAALVQLAAEYDQARG